MQQPTDSQFIPYRNLLGQILTTRRTLLRRPQKEVASGAGMHPATLSRIESGETPATIEQLGLIANQLNTSPGSILQEVDNMVAQLQVMGHQVLYSPAGPPGLKPMEAAALGGLLALIFTSSRR